MKWVYKHFSITEYFKRFLIGELSRKVPCSNMLNTPLASTQFCCLISLCKTFRNVIRFSALTILGASPRTNDGLVKDNLILFMSVARRPSLLQSAVVSAFLFRLVGMLEPYSASTIDLSAICSGSIFLAALVILQAPRYLRLAQVFQNS